jgi:hypothetical protein
VHLASVVGNVDFLEPVSAKGASEKRVRVATLLVLSADRVVGPLLPQERSCLWVHRDARSSGEAITGGAGGGLGRVSSSRETGARRDAAIKLVIAAT